MPRAADASLIRILCLKGTRRAGVARGVKSIYRKKRADASPFFTQKKS
jgi:hypothetical protein